MGRRKVEGRFEDEKQLKKSYHTRKKGLLKKANELSILCGADVGVEIYPPDDHKGNNVSPCVWPPNQDSLNRVINRFYSTSQELRRKHESKVGDYIDQKQKHDDEDADGGCVIDSDELSHIENLSPDQLMGLLGCLDTKLAEVNSRINMIKTVKAAEGVEQQQQKLVGNKRGMPVCYDGDDDCRDGHVAKKARYTTVGGFDNVNYAEEENSEFMPSYCQPAVIDMFQDTLCQYDGYPSVLFNQDDCYNVADFGCYPSYCQPADLTIDMFENTLCQYDGYPSVLSNPDLCYNVADVGCYPVDGATVEDIWYGGTGIGQDGGGASVEDIWYGGTGMGPDGLFNSTSVMNAVNQCGEEEFFGAVLDVQKTVSSDTDNRQCLENTPLVIDDYLDEHDIEQMLMAAETEPPQPQFHPQLILAA